MSLKTQIMRAIGTISPMLITRILYKKTFGKSLNLKNPQTLNEKIHWMKFYGDTSQWGILADKYRVREYVKEKGFQSSLVKLYGKWDSVEKINWNQLPDQFVMKVNNGCGDVLICTDKSQLDIESTKKSFRPLLKEKFGIQTGQTQYKDMPACIIAEELLDAAQQHIKSTSLVDYKIWCFNGKPFYIFVYLNRKKGGIAECMIYDVDWVAHPEYLIPSDHFAVYNESVPKPSCLAQMLRMASVLSEGHPEMRVDLYEVNNKVYFGELTLTAACGFMNHFTEDFMITAGNCITLPQKR